MYRVEKKCFFLLVEETIHWWCVYSIAKLQLRQIIFYLWRFWPLHFLNTKWIIVKTYTKHKYNMYITEDNINKRSEGRVNRRKETVVKIKFDRTRASNKTAKTTQGFHVFFRRRAMCPVQLLRGFSIWNEHIYATPTSRSRNKVITLRTHHHRIHSKTDASDFPTLIIVKLAGLDNKNELHNARAEKVRD